MMRVYSGEKMHIGKYLGAALAVLLCGCPNRFYVMYPVQVTAATAPAPSPPPATTTADDGLVPYLTLTAYAYTEHFFTATRDFNHDLQVFKVDAEFSLPNKPEPVSTVIMALDLASDPSSDHASRGREMLKSIPVIASSTTALDLRLSSSAVEKNLADRFLQGVDIIMRTAGPMLSSSLGPEATAAIGAGTDVLKLFKSNAKGTTSDRTVTLNPTGGILPATTSVFVFVPTGDQGPDEQLPDDQIGADNTLDSDANSKAFLRRLKKIQSTTFVYCSARPHALCSKKDGVETEFTDLAYMLIEPTYSYRITFPDFLWFRLPAQGSCQFEQKQVDAYAAALGEQRERMTPSQSGVEDEILASIKNVLVARALAGKPDVPGLFGLISTEWYRGTPAGRLYTMSHSTGRPYKDVQADLRECMVATGEAVKGGIFREYSGALTGLIEADRANAPANPTEAEALRQRYETVLPSLIGMKNNMTALSINAPEVSARLAYDISRADERIYLLVFRDPVAKLFSTDAAERAAAKATLKRLTATTNCETCKERTQKALVDSGQAGAPDAVVIKTVSGVRQELTGLHGEIKLSDALARAAGTTTDAATRQKLDAQMAKVEALLAEALATDKPVERDAKLKEARKLLDALRADARASHFTIQ